MSKVTVTNRRFLNDSNRTDMSSIAYEVESHCSWSAEDDVDFTFEMNDGYRSSLDFYGKSGKKRLEVIRDMINEALDAYDRAKEASKVELDEAEPEVQVDV